jgi:tRNA threonylcarbamoyladenosine biosynthesis protein TsaE
MSITIKTLEDLKEFARKTAAELKGGDIIGLVGELGAGKTTFTQFLAKELGIESDIKSPTFILFREYVTGQASQEKGIAKLVHADAYRIEDEDELWSIGFDDIISEPDTVTIIEWSDRLPSMRDYFSYKEFRFGFGEGDTREIDIAE